MIFLYLNVKQIFITVIIVIIIFLLKETFEENEMPEMSRCSLSRIVLMSKILDLGTPKQLLASALDPPVLNNIVLTILTLKQVILKHILNFNYLFFICNNIKILYIQSNPLN